MNIRSISRNLFAVVSGLALTLPLLSHAAENTCGLNRIERANITAQWWQWAWSMPNTLSQPLVPGPTGKARGSVHPLVGDNDDFGDSDFYEFCGNGQHGDVWFLGGDFSGTGEFFERTCVIPSDRTILLAVINLGCYTADGDGGAAPSQTLREQTERLRVGCVDEFADDLIGQVSVYDPSGELLDVSSVRIDSNAFTAYFPPYSVTERTYPNVNPSLALSTGQWLVLCDLEPGRYRVEFTGIYIDPDTFQLNGAYNLEIVQPYSD